MDKGERIAQIRRECQNHLALERHGLVGSLCVHCDGFSSDFHALGEFAHL
jgi:hypothetical protein